MHSTASLMKAVLWNKKPREAFLMDDAALVFSLWKGR